MYVFVCDLEIQDGPHCNTDPTETCAEIIFNGATDKQITILNASKLLRQCAMF